MSRPFTEVLAEIGSNDANLELTDGLKQLTEEVLAHSKPGEITLTVKVTPNGLEAVKVDYKIKTKLPEPNRMQSMFFVDEHGGLRRENPKQHKMHFRNVNEPEENVDPETGEVSEANG